jgi:hypothetical protein
VAARGCTRWVRRIQSARDDASLRPRIRRDMRRAGSEERPVRVSLICARPAGFPWLAVAGQLLAGWLVVDLNATLITARSDKEGAAPTFKTNAPAAPFTRPRG